MAENLALHSLALHWLIAQSRLKPSPICECKSASLPLVFLHPRQVDFRRSFGSDFKNSHSPPSISHCIAARESGSSTGWHKFYPKPTLEKLLVRHTWHKNSLTLKIWYIPGHLEFGPGLEQAVFWLGWPISIGTDIMAHKFHSLWTEEAFLQGEG